MWGGGSPPPSPHTFSPCRWYPPPPPPPPVFCAHLEKDTPIPGMAFAPCGFANRAVEKPKKLHRKPSEQQVCRLHDRVQNRGDSSADPGFERVFCLLTGVCCYRSAHAKGVRLASRSLFSQRRDAWRRAAECRGNGRGGHDQKNLLEKTYADEDANPPTWVMPRSWLSLR